MPNGNVALRVEQTIILKWDREAHVSVVPNRIPSVASPPFCFLINNR